MLGLTEPDPRSYYAATAHDHPGHPRLEGDRSADVLVVGGGYTGLSTALALRERGYSVILVEARRIGWGASGRNGGQAQRGYNMGLGDIKALAGIEVARTAADLEREARRLLADRVERHQIACDLKWGLAHCAVKPRQVRELRREVAELAEWGERDVQFLDRDALAAKVTSPRYLAGVYDPGSGHLHPLNYALGLARAARNAGAEIFEASPVNHLEVETVNGSRRVAAKTPQGQVTARYAALAGNAYLQPELSRAVRRQIVPKVMPVGTYIIATEPLTDQRVAETLPADIAVSDLNFVLNYYRLSADKRMLFGGRVSYHPKLEAASAKGGLARTMRHVFPSLAGTKVDYFWAGHVAITQNRLPDFGWLTPEIVYAQGFSGHGVVLTGIAGQLMAEALAGSAERFDVMARIPHRAFPGGRALRTPLLVLAMCYFRLRDWL